MSRDPGLHGLTVAAMSRDGQRVVDRMVIGVDVPDLNAAVLWSHVAVDQDDRLLAAAKPRQGAA